MRGDFRSARRPKVFILVEHPRQQLAQILRHVRDVGGVEPDRRGVQDRVDDRGRRPSFERAPAREHLVQHQAERKDVGSGVERIAEGLLGRHIQHRAHGGARVGQDAGVLAFRPGYGARRLGRHRRQTEVEQLRVAARRDEDVRRLHVAMDDAGAVRGAERVGDLHAHADNRLHRQRPGRQHFEQRQAAQQFHHDIRPVLGLRRLADVVDRADVRMIQPGERVRFALETQQVLFGGRQRGRQQLQGDIPPQLQIVRLVHLAHAAGAERRDDFKPPDDQRSWGVEARPAR